MFWIIYLIYCLFLFHLVLFLEFCPDLSFGIYFPVCSLGCLSVCFYELGKTATSPTLAGVTLCRSYPFIDCVCARRYWQATWSVSGPQGMWVGLEPRLTRPCSWSCSWFRPLVVPGASHTGTWSQSTRLEPIARAGFRETCFCVLYLSHLLCRSC